MTLQGKGFFIWQLKNCDGGSPEAIAARAVDAGLSHVLIKIADGSSWIYNYDTRTGIDYVPPVHQALKAKGLQVWGWHYVRGDNPAGEAKLAVKRMRSLGLDGYVIDAEAEYRSRSKRAAAVRFMKDLRAGLPNLPIALSTYRYPRVHPEFPFAEFLDRCDYAMPQVYFQNANNPEEQLERSVEQYMSLRPARPVVPTAPAYRASGWTPTSDEICRFLAKAKEIGLAGVNAWSWDYATRPEFIELWNAVARFNWDDTPVVEDVPEKLVAALNEHNPDAVTDLYGERAAHVTGERTVAGKEAIRTWYRSLLGDLLPNAEFLATGKSSYGNTRQFTWLASSPNGMVLDGSDLIGIREGQIEFHYTYFSVFAGAAPQPERIPT